jgi:K+-sensing histidine kinase KdpD
MFGPWRSPVSRYGGAVLLSAAATAARGLLDPVLGDTHPFATFFVAVVIAAWHGGVGPSLLTLALSTLAALYWFLQPRNSFEVHSIGDQVAVGLYVFIGVVTASLCESLRATQQRAESRQRQVEHEAAERRRVEEEWQALTRQLQEALIRQLQKAPATVKTLRGLLSLCDWCKSVRNDRGQWEPLETYLRDNLDVEFTYSICPRCAEQLQGEEHAPPHAPGS